MAEEITLDKEEKKEDWMQKRWRPMMAVLYMAVCAFDFMIAPILWSIVQALGNGGQIHSQWVPLTLQGAGLLHLSFGAILGVAAYGRTQEKLAGTANNNLANANQAPSTPSFGPSFGSGSVPLGGNSMSTAPAFKPAPAPAFTPAPAPSFGDKPLGPGRAEQPEL